MNIDSTHASSSDRWPGESKVPLDGDWIELEDFSQKGKENLPGNFSGVSVAPSEPNKKPKVDPQRFEREEKEAAQDDSVQKIQEFELLSISSPEQLRAKEIRDRIAEHEVQATALGVLITQRKEEIRQKNGVDIDVWTKQLYPYSQYFEDRSKPKDKIDYWKKACNCHLQAKKQLEQLMTVPENSSEAALLEEAIRMNAKVAKHYESKAPFVPEITYFSGGHSTCSFTSGIDRYSNEEDQALQQALRYLEISILDLGNRKIWQKAAAYSELEAKYCSQIVASLDEKKGKYYNDLLQSRRDAAETAGQASYFLFKSINDPTNAATWKEASVDACEAMRFNEQAMDLYKTGTEEASKVASSYKKAANFTKDASDDVAKSINDPTHATTWRKVVEWKKKAVHYELEVIGAYEKSVQGDLFNLYDNQQLARLSHEMAGYLKEQMSFSKNETMRKITNESNMASTQRSIDHHLSELQKFSDAIK